MFLAAKVAVRLLIRPFFSDFDVEGLRAARLGCGEALGGGGVTIEAAEQEEVREGGAGAADGISISVF